MATGTTPTTPLPATAPAWCTTRATTSTTATWCGGPPTGACSRNAFWVNPPKVGWYRCRFGYQLIQLTTLISGLPAAHVAFPATPPPLGGAHELPQPCSVLAGGDDGGRLAVVGQPLALVLVGWPGPAVCAVPATGLPVCPPVRRPPGLRAAHHDLRLAGHRFLGGLAGGTFVAGLCAVCLWGHEPGGLQRPQGLAHLHPAAVLRGGAGGAGAWLSIPA